MKKSVTCNKCGWVHFEVTRKHAEESIESFNKFAATLTPEERRKYYGKSDVHISSLRDYDRCNLCGGSYKNFRDSVESDCPDGCTIGPIIDRNE